MKKFTLFLLLVFSINTYSQWTDQYSGVSETLNDVYGITSDFAVIVGNSGTILKTVDGGQNWIQKVSGTTNDLKKLQFLNQNVGFASGAGVLLKTTDGGESWASIMLETIPGFSESYGLSVISESTFFIVSGSDFFKKTTDGGQTFEIVNFPVGETISKIQFLNTQTGYATGEQNLYKTIDGGQNWNVVANNVSSFYFLDENSGFIHSDEFIFKTSDGGLSLSNAGLSHGVSNDIFSLNANVFWEVNYEALLCFCPPKICVTKRDLTSIPDEQEIINCNVGSLAMYPLNAIHFANETTGYIVGEGGRIMKNVTGTMEYMSVDENRKKELVKLFPNPTSSQLNIEFTENPNQEFFVSVLDYLGKTIVAKTKQSKLDLTDISAGIYFAKIETDNGVSVQKFIRK